MKVGVIGLGYVGLQMAVSLSKKNKVIGFDIDKEKINCYRKGIDCTKEIGNGKINNNNIYYTTSEKDLINCQVFIVCVPTPNIEDQVDMSCVENACKIIKKYLTKDAIVIFESTMYIGATRNFCVPILDKSGLKYNKDYFVAFSPERINPGDEKHKLSNLIKVVGCEKTDVLNKIELLYVPIVGGIAKTNKLEVAEATKLIENVQRDVNIALINEFSKLCQSLNLNVYDVLEMANTKWNFCKFTPGLVGGHCIGVDTNYLLKNSKENQINLPVIQGARVTNEEMISHIADKIAKNIKFDQNLLVLGMTYKKNVPDFRNSKIFELVKKLQAKGIQCIIEDPYASKEGLNAMFNMNLPTIPSTVDNILLAVPHDFYVKNIEKYLNMLKTGGKIFTLSNDFKFVQTDLINLFS